MTRIGCEPDPGFLATGTKLSEQFSCVYFDRYMSIDLKKAVRVSEYSSIRKLYLTIRVLVIVTLDRDL